MDSELIVIFGFVLTIIVIVTLGINGIVGKTLRHRQWLEEHRAGKKGRASDEAHRALEERVRVLERIATEKNDPLALEIEQLRDLQDIDTELLNRERSQ